MDDYIGRKNMNIDNISFDKIKSAFYYKDTGNIEFTMINDDILTVRNISKEKVKDLIALGLDIKSNLESKTFITYITKELAKTFVLAGTIVGIVTASGPSKVIRMYAGGVPIKIAVESGLLGKTYIDERIKEAYYSTLEKLQNMFPGVNFNTSDVNAFLVESEKSFTLQNKNIAVMYSNFGMLIDESDKDYLGVTEHETIHHALRHASYIKKVGDFLYGSENNIFNEYLTSYVNYILTGTISRYHGAVYLDMLSSYIPIYDIVKNEVDGSRANTRKLLNQYSNGEFDILNLMEEDSGNQNVIKIKCKIIDMFFNYLYATYSDGMNSECENIMDNFWLSMLNRSTYWYVNEKEIDLVQKYYINLVEVFVNKVGYKNEHSPNI